MNLGDTFAVVALLATNVFVANNGFFEEISSSGRNLPEPKNVKAKGSKNSRKQRHQATKVSDVKRPSPLRWASFLTNSGNIDWTNFVSKWNAFGFKKSSIG